MNCSTVRRRVALTSPCRTSILPCTPRHLSPWTHASNRHLKQLVSQCVFRDIVTKFGGDRLNSHGETPASSYGGLLLPEDCAACDVQGSEMRPMLHGSSCNLLSSVRSIGDINCMRLQSPSLSSLYRSQSDFVFTRHPHSVNSE